MTKFKAGDKVRLVGEEYMGNVQGSEGTVVSVDADGEYLEASFPMEYEGVPESNTTYPYRVENLELIEEETKFEDVQVGDRVRLTAANGDVAEFTVVDGTGNVLHSAVNGHCKGDWEKAEILTRAQKPLDPGLYENGNCNQFFILLPDGRAFFTCNEGSWIAVKEENVRRCLEEESNQWTRQFDL